LSSASAITPKVLCSAVHLKSWLSTFTASAPRFSSSTMRMPSRSLSSRRSLTSPMRPARVSSATCSMMRDLLVPYGISVTTSCSRPLRRLSL
jgi:hypothetical protein